MNLKRLGVGLLLGFTLVLMPGLPAQAAKTLPGIAYTHTTSPKTRGTWYTHIKNHGYAKTVVKKHEVTWYRKVKRAGAWNRVRQLKNQHLYVYRYNLKVSTVTLKMFGFYAAGETGNAFHFMSTRNKNGKVVPIMVDANGSENYHAWKYVK